MTIEYILVDYENTQPKAAEVGAVDPATQRLWIFRGPGQKKYDAEFSDALLQLGNVVARVVPCEKSGANALDMHIAFELGRLAQQHGASGAVEFVIVSRDSDYDPLLQYLRKLGHVARREKSLKAALGGIDVQPSAAPPAGGKAAARPAARAKTARTAKPANAAAEAANPPAKKAARQAAKTPAKSPAKAPAKSRATSPAKAGAAAVATGTTKPSSKSGQRSPAGAPRAAKGPADDYVAAARASLLKHPKQRPGREKKLRSWLEGRHVPAQAVDAVIAALQAEGALRLEGGKVLYPPFE